MEIRVLRYFLEVAREGSVTHAAERLHISQPTLSKQLTDEGMLLRKRAEDILDMVDKTAAEFKALDEITGGDIHIGCAESDGIKHLARRIKAVQTQVPGIRVHLYSGDTNDLAERLDQGLLDFAVIAEAVDLAKYNYLELPGADVWGVVMRKDAPLAQKEAVGIDDLLDLPLLVFPSRTPGGYPEAVRHGGGPAAHCRHAQFDVQRERLRAGGAGVCPNL